MRHHPASTTQLVDTLVDLLRRRPSLCVHPLCGGLPPEIGWETLHLIATKVQPALA